MLISCHVGRQSWPSEAVHETRLLLLYSVGNRALVLSLPQNRRLSGTNGERCVLMYMCGGGRGRKESLWESNPISQDTTVIVLFPQPTFITPPVSLYQFTWQKIC